MQHHVDDVPLLRVLQGGKDLVVPEKSHAVPAGSHVAREGNPEVLGENQEVEVVIKNIAGASVHEVEAMSARGKMVVENEDILEVVAEAEIAVQSNLQVNGARNRQMQVVFAGLSYLPMAMMKRRRRN